MSLKKYSPVHRVKKKAKFFRYNLSKEFQLHKCLLHHYDLIDFTVFEFGLRVIYLVWRVLFMLLLPLLLLSVHQDLSQTGRNATPNSAFIYMHVWLVFLLCLSSLMEVAALGWAFIRMPTCELVKQRYVPWYFGAEWFFYNTVYANVFSCAFMYKWVFRMDTVRNNDYYLFLAVIVGCGVHVATTATPSRVAHFLHPLTLTLVHIFFTAVYQGNGGTDPQGNRFVYKNMSWSHKLDSSLIALLWLILTAVCHFSMVVSSWTRRKIYRRLRKGKEAVMNPNPDDDSSLCSLDTYEDQGLAEDGQEQHSPRIWIENLEQDPRGHKRVTIESPPPNRTRPPSLPTRRVYYEQPRRWLPPGERRRRLMLEGPPPNPSGAVCFLPSRSSALPPGSRHPHFHHPGPAPVKAPVDRSYICHPEFSPDGRSFVYKCMPQGAPRPKDCYACAYDRRLGLLESGTNSPWLLEMPPPREAEPKAAAPAHTFTVCGGRPVQTRPLVMCPRDDYAPTDLAAAKSIPSKETTHLSSQAVQIDNEASA